MKPPEDPRLSGMKEHLTRIQAFLRLASESGDPAMSFRHLMAGIYSARAITELMLEPVTRVKSKEDRDRLEDQIRKKLPWYDLIERIRIHDFHRFGIAPPDPGMACQFLGGPLKLTASKGSAFYQILAGKPTVDCTGDSSVKQQRPLVNVDGNFFDEDSDQYVALPTILTDFAQDAPSAITWFAAQSH